MLFYHGTSRLMDLLHHHSTFFYHRTNSFMDHQIMLEVFCIKSVRYYIFFFLNFSLDIIYSLKEICTKAVFDFYPAWSIDITGKGSSKRFVLQV